jgi:hypothetical protein
MNPPPAIVHAAADLRRKELLAEAVSDRGAAPPASARVSWLCRVVRRVAGRGGALVSWVVDEFEPMPAPTARMDVASAAGREAHRL